MLDNERTKCSYRIPEHSWRERSSHRDSLARSLTSAVKPKILYYGISEMIDPSITGRAGLAWSFEEHESGEAK